MNQLQTLDQSSTLVKQWVNLNDTANKAYKDLISAARKKGINSLPKESVVFLQSCPAGQFREKMQPLLARPDIAIAANTYLSAVDQLIVLAGKIAGGAPQSVPQPPVAQPTPPTQPITGAPPEPVTAPTAGIVQPQPPVAIQQRLDQSALEIARQIEQAQAALAETRQQIEAFRLQTGHSLASLVTMQDWSEVAGKLYTSEDRRRKSRDSIVAKLVEVIIGCEQQYLISAQRVLQGEAASNDVESPFQASVRSIIGRFEHVLASEFSVMRMPITPGSTPDPNSMIWNKDAFETPPTRELAGRVAYVTAPGYYTNRADGNQVYRRAQVVLYSPLQ